jgi:hypothetical protein
VSQVVQVSYMFTCSMKVVAVIIVGASFLAHLLLWIIAASPPREGT